MAHLRLVIRVAAFVLAMAGAVLIARKTPRKAPVGESSPIEGVWDGSDENLSYFVAIQSRSGDKRFRLKLEDSTIPPGTTETSVVVWSRGRRRIELWRKDRLLHSKVVDGRSVSFPVAVPEGTSEWTLRAVSPDDAQHVGRSIPFRLTKTPAPLPIDRRLKIRLDAYSQARIEACVDVDLFPKRGWAVRAMDHQDGARDVVAAGFQAIEVQGRLIQSYFEGRPVTTKITNGIATFSMESEPISPEWVDLGPTGIDEIGDTSEKVGEGKSVGSPGSRHGFKLALQHVLSDNPRLPLEVRVKGPLLSAIGHQPAPVRFESGEAVYKLENIRDVRNRLDLVLVLDRPTDARSAWDWKKREFRALRETDSPFSLALTFAVAAAGSFLLSLLAASDSGDKRRARTLLAISLVPFTLAFGFDLSLGRFKPWLKVLGFDRLPDLSDSAYYGGKTLLAGALAAAALTLLIRGIVEGARWVIARAPRTVPSSVEHSSPLASGEEQAGGVSHLAPAETIASEFFRGLSRSSGLAVVFAALIYYAPKLAAPLFGLGLAGAILWAAVPGIVRLRWWGAVLAGVGLAFPLTIATLFYSRSAEPSPIYLPYLDAFSDGVRLSEIVRTAAVLLAFAPIVEALEGYRKGARTLADGNAVLLLTLGIVAFNATGGRPLAALPVDALLAWVLARPLLIAGQDWRASVERYAARVRAMRPYFLETALCIYDAPRVRLALQSAEKKLVKNEITLQQYVEQEKEVIVFEKKLARRDRIRRGRDVRIRDLALSIPNEENPVERGLRALGWGWVLSLPVVGFGMVGSPDGVNTPAFLQALGASLAQYWIGSFLFGYGLEAFRGNSNLKKGFRMAILIAFSTSVFTLLDRPDGDGARIALLQSTGSLIVYPLLGLLAFDLEILARTNHRTNSGAIYVRINGLGRLTAVGSVVASTIAASALTALTNQSRNLFEEIAQAAISRTLSPSADHVDKALEGSAPKK